MAHDTWIREEWWSFDDVLMSEALLSVRMGTGSGHRTVKTGPSSTRTDMRRCRRLRCCMSTHDCWIQTAIEAGETP